MVVIKRKNYEVSPSDSFFFDTNIWFFIYGPMAGTQSIKQKAYSSLLSEILSRSATIFISSLVVSEFINRVLRLNFETWKKANGFVDIDFKKVFRGTAEYNSALVDAKDSISEILKIAVHCPDDFNSVNIDALVGRIDNSIDFNDVYYIHLCEKMSAKLVSDDSDFWGVNSKVQLITA